MRRKYVTIFGERIELRPFNVDVYMGQYIVVAVKHHYAIAGRLTHVSDSVAYIVGRVSGMTYGVVIDAAIGVVNAPVYADSEVLKWY